MDGASGGRLPNDADEGVFAARPNRLPNTLPSQSDNHQPPSPFPFPTLSFSHNHSCRRLYLSRARRRGGCRRRRNVDPAFMYYGIVASWRSCNKLNKNKCSNAERTLPLRRLLCLPVVYKHRVPHVDVGCAPGSFLGHVCVPPGFRRPPPCSLPAACS